MATPEVAVKLVGLKVIRAQHALSQRELARRAGLTWVAINRLETGHASARPSTVVQLSTALNVEPEVLIDGPTATDASDGEHDALQVNGARLRSAREEQKLSVAGLAARAGLPRVTVWRIETGRGRPHPRTTRKLAEALGLAPAALLGPLPASALAAALA
ncbi:MAG: HTH-type transcriptional regulator, competence development regulator [Chloroflexota bacterium]|jgi:transcriptional regulator with XRE-family HTH domain|nr:HTH-type transcriptional regulator, competence development regulator [Chloroflexota bacterium]